MEKFIGRKWSSLSQEEGASLINMIIHSSDTYKENKDINVVIYFENGLKIDGYVKSYDPVGHRYEIDIYDDAILTEW